MSRVGNILINAIKDKMEFYKRNATGEAVESLQERPTSNGIQIVGVDYFDNIFNGTPAGTLVDIVDLARWKSAKESRYSIKLPSVEAIQTSISNNGAPKDKDGLNIDAKVLNEQRQNIDKEIKIYINKIVRNKV